jgi:cation:H+ antiporter
MTTSLFVLAMSLALVIKGATMATTYAERLSMSFPISRYTIGFIVVAIISILPETFIGIVSALQGTPDFGLGVLFGSNVADLTLIFAIIIFFSKHSLKAESKILKNHLAYPAMLALPLVLGLDGFYSRVEGAALILAGAAFYFVILREGSCRDCVVPAHTEDRIKNTLLLVVSMVLLLLGAHFTVASATTLATLAGVSPILVAMLVVGLGTTLPELFFSLSSVNKRDDSLAIGDILGTVLADATVVVGVIALIHPFTFPLKIIYVTGVCMLVASFLLFRFLRSGKTLTMREGKLLFLFWIAFVFVELAVSL